MAVDGFQPEPFPHRRSLFRAARSRQGRGGAAAKRTLDGEDRSDILKQEGKAQSPHLAVLLAAPPRCTTKFQNFCVTHLFFMPPVEPVPARSTERLTAFEAAPLIKPPACGWCLTTEPYCSHILVQREAPPRQSSRAEFLIHVTSPKGRADAFCKLAKLD